MRCFCTQVDVIGQNVYPKDIVTGNCYNLAKIILNNTLFFELFLFVLGYTAAVA